MALVRRIFGIPERIEEEPRPEHDRELAATKRRVDLLRREVELAMRESDRP